MVMLENRLARRNRSSWLRSPSPAGFAVLACLIPVATIGAVLPIGTVVVVPASQQDSTTPVLPLIQLWS